MYEYFKFVLVITYVHQGRYMSDIGYGFEQNKTKCLYFSLNSHLLLNAITALALPQCMECPSLCGINVPCLSFELC